MKKMKPKGHEQIMKIAIQAAKKGKKPPKRPLVDKDGDVDFSELAHRGGKC